MGKGRGRGRGGNTGAGGAGPPRPLPEESSSATATRNPRLQQVAAASPPPVALDFPTLVQPVRLAAPISNTWGVRAAVPSQGIRPAGSPVQSIPLVRAIPVAPPSQQVVTAPSAPPVPPTGQQNSPLPSSSVSSITSSVAQLALGPEKSQGDMKETTIMKRPDGANGYANKLPGGRDMKVVVNHYGIRFKDGQVIHHYSLAISAQANGKEVRAPLRASLKREIMSEFRRLNPQSVLGTGKGQEIAFNKADEIFTGRPLAAVEDGQEKTFDMTVRTDGDSREYQCLVTLKKVKATRASDVMQAIKKGGDGASVEDCIRPIDTILRQAFLSGQRAVEVGRSLFVPSSNFNLPDGLVGITKLFATVRPSGLAEQLAVVLHTSAGAFYKEQSVFDYLRDHGAFIPPSDNVDAKTFRFEGGGIECTEGFLKGLKVTYAMTDPNGRPYEATKTVRGLGRLGADKQKFTLEEKGHPPRQVTVQGYYKEKYGKTLLYPQVQCLQVSSDPNRGTYIPMELCRVQKNQQLSDQIAPAVLQEMIKRTALNAPNRMAMSQTKRNALENLKGNPKTTNPVLNDFGLVVNGNMAVVDAHVLPIPVITQSGRPFRVRPDASSWQSDEARLETPMPLSKWMLVVLEAGRFFVPDKFIFELKKAGQMLGMDIANPSHPTATLRVNEVKNLMSRLPTTAKDLQLIIFIIADRAPEHVHNDVKQVLETNGGGIRSQFIKQKVAGSDRNLANVLRKINVKLGGVNHVVQIPAFLKQTNVMLIGADVTHPSGAGLKTRPSLAAVVGSMDRQMLKYRAEVRAQVNPGGKLKETITDFEEMMDCLFEKFPLARGPDVIFYYRDGVSEGQYAQVLMLEFNAIVRAFTRRYQREPKITFIVVTKRHQTRMECANTKDSVGKAQNVPPGTVVDKDLCSVKMYDWYMVSHHGIQGTSRPAHYIVLLDQNGYSADKLQELSYALTYGYARCTRSVSLPIPVYYAHHAAFRAREHLGEGMYYGLSQDGAACRRDLQQIHLKITPTDTIKNGGMYFL